MQKSEFRLSRVSTVLVGIKDVGRALAFYRDVLGLPLRAQFEGFTFFDAGVTLVLSEALGRAVPQGSGTGGAFEVVFAVEGVRDAFEALKAKGVTFKIEPRVVTGTSWAANFDDPDGNHLSVFGPEKAG